jgi:hypothetical protein
MNIDTLREAVLYCTIINLGFLTFWGLLSLAPHEWMYRWVGRVFRLSAERLDAINYAGILLYKLAILLFNLVPYLALRIVT